MALSGLQEMPGRRIRLLLLLLSVLAGTAQSASVAEWRSRTLFQLLTDRFATDQCWGGKCDDGAYCGGTFSGVRKQISYIQDLGFDSIWLSPFSEQGPDAFGVAAYHGYWPSNFYKVNPAFGTQQELVELVQYYQQQGMFVLFDQVINHVGYGDYAQFSPFNQSTDFHDCNGCYTLNCQFDPYGRFGGPSSAHSFEHCKLSGLPDLNHSDPSVLQRMVDWHRWTLDTFKPDGVRFDAATNSLDTFVHNLSRAVGPDTWTISELFLGYPFKESAELIANWVHSNHSDSAFAFPMTDSLRRALRERKHDMSWLAERRADWLRLYGDKVHDMASFADNHDTERWLKDYPDKSRFMNALTYILFMEGIPFIYYGTEQGFGGHEREPLWYSRFSHSNPLWLFLRVSIAYRKQTAIWDAGIAEQHHVDNNTWVLSRGDFVFALSAVGEEGPADSSVHTLSGLPERFRGKTLRNIYNPKDTLEVDANGGGMFIPDLAGKPQAFFLGQVQDPQSFFIPDTEGTDRLVTADLYTFLALVPVVMLLTLGMMQCWALRQQAIVHADEAGPGDSGGFAAPLLRGAAGFGGAKPGIRGFGTRRLWGSGGCCKVDASGTLSAAASMNGGGKAGGLEVARSASSLDRSRSADLNRLRSISGKQAMADAAEAADRFESFSISTAVFRNPSQVSAVDLAQGLVAEEYLELQRAGRPSDASEEGVHGVVCELSTPFQIVEHEAILEHGDTPSPPGSPSTPVTPTVTTFAAPMPLVTVDASAVTPASSVRSQAACRNPLQQLARSSRGSFNAMWRMGHHKSTLSEAHSLRTFEPTAMPILHVALEYSIPHLGFTNQLMYGGLGMVVDTFIKQWHGPMAVVAPLYKPCYGPLPNSSSSSGGAAGSEAKYDAPHPSFVPAYQKPFISLTVHVAGRQLPAEVFKVEASEAGQPRTYYLIQSELFRHRERGQIYTFADEDEMLTWLAVFNQAIAAVVMREGISHMQLHDYHGGLSLMYMPEPVRPAVLYVAHNAHYDATFPIPTTARRNKVYEHLCLNAEQVERYAEYNGSFDILRAVVMFLHQHQQGYGVVAVSPRYAEQITQKLSVFWQLGSVYRPRTITGILNSLDMCDSLAASKLGLDAVMAAKSEAKRRLQETYGLAVGEQNVLLVFIGRITHQKGCDIIAEAAPYIMAKHPGVQLVVLGPIGDAVGASASAKLAALSSLYPERMYCPMDYYVAGDEKHLLLTASDFCLIPSRFEPCGLVDIEFGWNGGLIIGHDTGGLGKMPGVYFTAQASHLSHLARKLEEAVDRAVSLSPDVQRSMVKDALAKRFPAKEMMQQYSQAWQQIDRQYVDALRSRRTHLRRLRDHAAFFSNKWASVNKKSVAAGPPGGAAAGTAAPAAAALTGASLAGPMLDLKVSSLKVQGGMTASPSCSSLYELGTQLSSQGSDGEEDKPRRAWLQHFPAAQRLSNYLLVAMQYWGLGPGVLLLSFLLLQEIIVSSYGKCALAHNDWAPTELVLPGLGVSTNDFVVRLIGFFFLSTASAPLWFWLAARCRPYKYIRAASVLIFASYALTFVAIARTEVMSVAVALTAFTSLVATPTLSLGFLGDHEVEVSEVGRRMLTLSESVKYVLLCVAMLLAATVQTALPHQFVCGACMLLSAALMTWFCHPMCLSKAYRHMALTFKGQWQLLKHLSCFWYTLLASICDSLAFMLAGFLVISATEQLDTFAAFQAIAFGGCAAAVLWNYKFLCSRTAELRLNACMLGLAAMPFYQLLKAVVVVTQPPKAVLLGACAAIDFIMGGRSSVVGLAGFVTLPSRETVTIWQSIAVLGGTGSAMLIVALGHVAKLSGHITSSWVLFFLIAGLEVVRAVVMACMSRRYATENLSAP